jgi:hypothetical protein
MFTVPHIFLYIILDVILPFPTASVASSPFSFVFPYRLRGLGTAFTSYGGDLPSKT